MTKYTGIVAFAKASLILDGHVKIERAAVHHFEGADMTKAKDVKESLGSKGGAALALRCFDTTFAVISVHMAKEWHKVAQVEQGGGSASRLQGLPRREGKDRVPQPR